MGQSSSNLIEICKVKCLLGGRKFFINEKADFGLFVSKTGIKKVKFAN